MIIALALVQPACAEIVTLKGSYLFHRVSDPVTGALPRYRINGAIPKGAAQ